MQDIRTSTDVLGSMAQELRFRGASVGHERQPQSAVHPIKQACDQKSTHARFRKAPPSPASIRYNSYMMTLRRLVLFLLLLTVPFQAAVGATGYVCGHGSHHAGASAVASGDNSPTVGHRHDRAFQGHGASSHASHHGDGHVSLAGAADAVAQDATGGCRRD